MGEEGLYESDFEDVAGFKEAREREGGFAKPKHDDDDEAPPPPDPDGNAGETYEQKVADEEDP